MNLGHLLTGYNDYKLSLRGRRPKGRERGKTSQWSARKSNAGGSRSFWLSSLPFYGLPRRLLQTRSRCGIDQKTVREHPSISNTLPNIHQRNILRRRWGWPKRKIDLSVVGVINCVRWVGVCQWSWINQQRINLCWTKHFPGNTFELSLCKQNLFLPYTVIWPHVQSWTKVIETHDKHQPFFPWCEFSPLPSWKVVSLPPFSMLETNKHPRGVCNIGWGKGGRITDEKHKI